MQKNQIWSTIPTVLQIRQETMTTIDFKRLKKHLLYQLAFDLNGILNLFNLQILREKFHLNSFRTNQREAIEAAISPSRNNNIFVLMASGAGKSLCYQLPAIMGNKVTFVISPLLSLILDQVKKLESLNVIFAHSSIKIS